MKLATFTVGVLYGKELFKIFHEVQKYVDVGNVENIANKVYLNYISILQSKGNVEKQNA